MAAADSQLYDSCLFGVNHSLPSAGIVIDIIPEL
jgi:hypothetical protein